MLWSPALVSLPAAAPEPPKWDLEAIEKLNPPRDHQAEWARLAPQLERSQPANAWQGWQRLALSPPAGGFFRAYQNRLSGLRWAQLEATAERLRPLLEKNDLPAYRQQLPLRGEERGPLGLALTLQPLSEVGREDLLPESWWWEILVQESHRQALRAGVRLARGQQPEMPHRWEGRTCVCWTFAVDGRDDGGQLEAPLDQPGSNAPGDWIYRFR